MEAAETYLLSLEGTPKELCTAMRSTLVVNANSGASFVPPQSPTSTSATPIGDFTFPSGTMSVGNGGPINPSVAGTQIRSMMSGSPLSLNLNSKRNSIIEQQEE